MPTTNSPLTSQADPSQKSIFLGVEITEEAEWDRSLYSIWGPSVADAVKGHLYQFLAGKEGCTVKADVL